MERINDNQIQVYEIYQTPAYNIYEDILISENREKEREDYVAIRKNMYE